MNPLVFFIIIIIFSLGVLVFRLSGGRINTPGINNYRQYIPGIWFVASLVVVGITVFYLIPEFFPKFWTNIRNSKVFWILLLVMTFSMYMYMERGIQAWGLVVSILFILIVFKYGSCNGCHDEEEASTSFGQRTEQVEITLWRFDSSGDSSIYFEGVTPFEDPLNFKFRLEVECNKSVTVTAPGWETTEVVTGCTKEKRFPARRAGNVRIRAVP